MWCMDLGLTCEVYFIFGGLTSDYIFLPGVGGRKLDLDGDSDSRQVFNRHR